MSRTLLIQLPDLIHFRSARSTVGPFGLLRVLLERDLGTRLSFDQIALGPADFAALRDSSLRWLKMRRKLGFGTSFSLARELDVITSEGRSAPVVNPRLRRGDCLVRDLGREAA